MGKWICLLIVFCMFFVGGCVRHKKDQYLPVPELPSEDVVVDRIIVFPFVADNSVPNDVRECLYHSVVRYLIEKCDFFVVHPDIAREYVTEGKLLSRKEMINIAYKLGVEGFVVGFLSDFRRDPSFRISVDVNLYPVVGDENMVKHGFLVYDTSDRQLVSKMKRYANMFDWSKLPLGWRRLLIKPQLFCDFVAWDLVESVFLKKTD